MVSFNVVYCYFRFSEVWMEFMEMIIFCYDVGVVVVGENIIVKDKLQINFCNFFYGGYLFKLVKYVIVWSYFNKLEFIEFGVIYVKF